MPDPESEDNDKPVTIDISLRAQIRKERIVALVFFLVICGLVYIVYVNLH